MTREEIIKMAQDAGALVYGPVNHERFVKTGRFSGPVVNEVIDVLFTPETLEHFVTLVAAAEREACAKVCEDFADGTSAYEVHHRFAAYKCAEIIRKRGGDENIS